MYIYGGEHVRKFCFRLVLGELRGEDWFHQDNGLSEAPCSLLVLRVLRDKDEPILDFWHLLIPVHFASLTYLPFSDVRGDALIIIMSSSAHSLRDPVRFSVPPSSTHALLLTYSSAVVPSITPCHCQLYPRPSCACTSKCSTVSNDGSFSLS